MSKLYSHNSKLKLTLLVNRAQHEYVYRSVLF